MAIDPLGHDLKDGWYIVTPATTTSEGLEQRDCHRDGCTYSETRVIPKLPPSTPDPDTPSTPEVTPDAPAQEKTPAEAEVLPAADGTEAGAPVKQTTVTTPAALPKTGANWLAAVGSALGGIFLLAAGFVLDRKSRRMN